MPSGLASVRPNEQNTIRLGRHQIQGMSAFLQVQMCGEHSELLVDTGAAVTIISSALFSQIPAEKRPQLKPPCKSTKLETASKELIDIDGIVTVEIVIGGQPFKWDAIVAPISDQGILGYDFLYHYDCILQARHGIRIAGNWVPWTVKGSPPCAIKIALKQNTTIPACSEWIAEGVADRHELDSEYAVVEPANLRHNVVVGSSLIDPSRDDIDIPVRLLNLSPENIELQAGTTIAYLHEVDAVELLAEQENCEADHLYRVTRVCREHARPTSYACNPVSLSLIHI